MIAAALSLLGAIVIVSGIARIPALRRRATATSAAAVVIVGLLVAAALCARAAGTVTGAAQVAAYVLTVLAAALSADGIVRAVFDVGIVRKRARAEDSSADDPNADDPNADGRPGPLRGGLTIGVLERTAVTAAVLAGWPGGIAVVLAVKGLARYPELREPDASEQFIIGTFTSVLISLAVAGVGVMLVR
ncbi:hypothetical protein [Tomitella fengzijianii]|uniref:Uncharacterized protein n=1 Tax=Tomitella fengzijianii TaxID=2597660 RepID=A0A516X2X5_9ACTN|nr:hypothetical protein [Tomitella fengzijianii]QDQ97410.1 hypothetical protein FO059_08815 [Tomitella fengzijianii]